ncbi:hypothetical protein Tco_1196938 [Tanacetum coccineum]
MWEAIMTHILGVDRAKEERLHTLITEFENLKMLNNGTIDEYVAKLSGIASKSTILREVMSEHKLVKKFLTSLPRQFVHIVTALVKVLDLKETGFEDVVGRLKAYEERIKEEDKANDAQENLLYADANISNRNIYSSKEEDVVQTLRSCPNLNEMQEENVYHEEDTFFIMNLVQETIFINEEKYTPPNIESNTEEGDVWHFDNGASNPDSNVISHGQATISSYDISIKGDFLTMRDSCGGLPIKVPRSANCLYKTQLKVGKLDSNQESKEPRTVIVLWDELQEDRMWKYVASPEIAGQAQPTRIKIWIKLGVYLMYSVGVVSRYMQSLRESRSHAIKQILRYLKGTTSFGTEYKRGNDMKLVVNSDTVMNVDIA